VPRASRRACGRLIPDSPGDGAAQLDDDRYSKRDGALAAYSFRKTKIFCAKERGDYARAKTSLARLCAPTSVTISRMVKDLELMLHHIHGTVSGRIEYCQSNKIPEMPSSPDVLTTALECAICHQTHPVA